MSLTCDWLVLAERVIDDSQSASLTLVNCLDEVNPWSLPSALPGFGFAARFRRAEDDLDEDRGYEFRFLRSSRTDPERLIVATSAHLAAGAETLRVFFNFAMLRLYREEVIAFRIDWRIPGQRWRHGPTVPLRVRLLPKSIRDEVSGELEQLQRELSATDPA